jgi:hypothetical protein
MINLIRVGDVVEWFEDDLPYGADRNPGRGTVTDTRGNDISGREAAVIWFTGWRRESMWFNQCSLILMSRAK